jgi:hypothetical protein
MCGPAVQIRDHALCPCFDDSEMIEIPSAAVPRDPFAPGMHELQVIVKMAHESLGIPPIGQVHVIGLALGLPVGAPIIAPHRKRLTDRHRGIGLSTVLFVPFGAIQLRLPEQAVDLGAIAGPKRQDAAEGQVGLALAGVAADITRPQLGEFLAVGGAARLLQNGLVTDVR